MRTTETIGTDMKENTIIEQLPTDKKTNSYEYSAIDRIIEESGLRVSLGMIEECYLAHTIQRGYLSGQREDLIRELRQNTDWRYEKIIGLVNRVKQMETKYPDYDIRLNEKLDYINSVMTTMKPFIWVDNRLIGICNERSAYVVYDGTQENRLIKLADINKKDYSIVWNKGQSISIPQQRHIIDMRREIKDRIV